MYLFNKKQINVAAAIIVTFLVSQLGNAQQFSLDNKESSLIVLGTSNLHDWHITAETHKGLIQFNDIKACGIEKLKIAVVVESLKSGKKSMDKNTYKALHSDRFGKITYELTDIKDVTNKSDGKFHITSLGNLTIMDVTKPISLDLSVDIIKNKIVVSGTKKINMTDFNVKPPTALFGTITTGEDVTIKFTTIFKEQSIITINY
ncbi:YceI family protein [Changchengzhania lutea]|uniref:YceI family protein n=1 Tax=Changchengzhania lutea TaxID=2049305 RepID=UPI00115E4A1B|nr:YceI family protein [Changchengzhania lutea]